MFAMSSCDLRSKFVIRASILKKIENFAPSTVGMALPEPKKYTVGFRVEVTDG
jgi:hypothetical protein